MKTKLNGDTAAPLHKTHTIRLHFDETPEDQALYAALCASSHQQDRTPLSRQAKYLLGMAIRLEARIAKIEEEIREFSANAAALYVPPPPTRPSTTLRLIPGAADKQERTFTHDNNSRD